MVIKRPEELSVEHSPDKGVLATIFMVCLVDHRSQYSFGNMDLLTVPTYFRSRHSDYPTILSSHVRGIPFSTARPTIMD